ncbi:RHS repeat-associated core domain-containing protein [Streptomyces sp. NPDC088789]|uniref:RHS repeat-associated core domain-containing protein n=1 Tax=Streptomyces sp. NPDC088789 TaxID=3365899 RepID=UPI00382091DA
MSATSQVFSHATGNFSSAVSGGVDPRTGLFGVQIALGHIVGNRNLGPSLPLTLSYSPLNDTDLGFGLGVSFGLTTYDVDQRLLTLAGGEQYRVQETGTQVVLQQHKLDTVHMARDQKRNRYRIAHKSGDVEELTGPRNGHSLKVPAAVLNPAGHRLDLSWDFTAGPQPRLTAVRDGQEEKYNKLLTVEYAGQSKTTLHVLPGQEEGYDVELRFRNGLLGSVHHFGTGPNRPPLVWEFTHTEVGDPGEWGSWITGVSMPGGMTETVWYRDDGHRFPATAGMPALPCVYRYVQTPGGGQPRIEAAYDYTDTNFLGGHSEMDWDSSRDCLYDVLTQYTYGSTESRTCAGQTTRTTRTYNNYHLLTTEKQQQNHCSHTVETQYYAVIGKPFEEQQPQFQLPRKRTVTWADSRQGTSRVEITETDYDTSGNPRSQTEPDGRRTEWTYYPAKGNADCPPDPNGFTRLLKSVVRKPSDDAGVFPDSPDYTTTYRYTAHDVPAKGSPVKKAVLKSEEQHYAGTDRLLRGKVYSYSTSDALEFGRLTGLVETEYDDTGAARGHTAHTFAFSLDKDTLVQAHATTVQVSSQNPLTLTRSERHSRFTGRVRSETDTQGHVTEMTYDRLGRLLTRTTNATDATYTATEHHVYEVGGSFAFTAQSTDVLGNRIRQGYDGAGRLLQTERSDIGDDGQHHDWCVIQRQTYDEQGRPASVTVLDQLPDGTEKTQLTRTFVYDDWGQVRDTVDSDGPTHRVQTDPVARTSTTQLLAASGARTGREVTTHDQRGEPVSVERFGLDEKSVGKRTLKRDGWGRVRSETDEMQHTTRYDHDLRGRLISTTLPDETTKVTHAYAPFSSDALPTEIRVNAACYGTQEFDGLGRLRSATSGGRTWSYHYAADHDPLPASVILPDSKTTHEFQYVRQLGNVLSQVTADGIWQRFEHDPVSGALRQASEGKGDSEPSVTITRAYHRSGRLHTETLSGQPEHTATRDYTVGGRQHSYQGVDGRTQRNARDTFGRVAAVVDPDMEAALKYDALGRVVGWTGTDPRTKTTVTTVLDLDAFGREKARTITDGQGTTWTLEHTWQPNSLLSRRTFTRGTTTLRDETFTYSKRNQLTAYTCTGDAPPADGQRKITGQTFVHDAYGNITGCTTTFADGTSAKTEYMFDNKDDPCQLTGIHTASGQTDLSYDPAGRLTKDDAGRTLTYDVLGRLREADTASTYAYDPLDRLLTQHHASTTSTLHYQDTQLALVTEGERTTRLLHLGAACAAQHRSGAGQSETRLLGTDGKGTVLIAAAGKNHEESAYTAYGHRTAGGDTSILGYDGQRTDPATGWLHLGNGYRAYHPLLMRFTTPDSLSPFGAGGINPYAYCLGDPVNRTDPTGHLSWGTWLNVGIAALGVGLAVFTGGTSIAAAVGVMATVAAVTATTLGVVSATTAVFSAAEAERNPGTSAILGFVSLGTGVAEFGVGAAPAGARLLGAAGRGLSRLAGRSGRYTMPAEEAAAFSQGGAAYRRYLNSLPEHEFGGNGRRPASTGNPEDKDTYPSEVAQRRLGRASRPGEVPLTPNPTPSRLYHYTDAKGYEGITQSGRLRPSMQYQNWAHAREGSGQYLTDLHPALNTPEYISRQLVFSASPANLERFSHVVAIDVTGLEVVRPDWFRPHVYLIQNTVDLPVANRIVSLV